MGGHELVADLGYGGRSVVVAGGGGQGMGAAAVSLLVAMGADVTVLDLRESDVEGARFRQTDLSSPAAIDKAVEELGTVDALFNCQGISGSAPGTDATTVMAVNFLGVRHLTEALLPKMSDGSAVVSISSAGGLGWERKVSQITSLLAAGDMNKGLVWCEGERSGVLRAAFPNAYAFSKQALIFWSLQLSETSISRGVRVNVTCPGSTATPMAGDFPDMGVETMNHPIGRTSVPVEQAWPIVFLNSPRASYINGVNVPVDGGNNAARVIGRMVQGS
ncbi:SDR family oxidoreductase [Rhodococcus wratislaviensis]|uniref:Putative oxidoreductase n=1 Tax=Rhodococcus wratislaviensis NBRC 100605 TaxID=1219028 RepID=X0RER4_RHOWR|nr:SDR family oxidoreductase [Rhodococcus wratislaviensis]GAF49525.1 putative oxidoreductase [Rhodococcus wratislaviensis NBRC 100605]